MLNSIIIRPIRESDAVGIHAVALEAWQHTYRNIFDHQFIENFVNQNYAPEALLSLFPQIQAGGMCFLVAEHQASLIGFCHLGLRRQIAELYRIYLLPAYIGQGVGRSLLESGEKFLLARGVSTYFCFVHKDIELGKRFYLQSGFQHVAEKDHTDEWYMEKKVASPDRKLFNKTVHISAPPSRVWNVLTTPELMKTWMMPDIELSIRTDWKVGNPIVIRGTMNGKDFENTGTVLQFEPEKILQYSHLSSVSRLPDRPESYTVIEFRLDPWEDHTILELTLRNFPTESIHKHLAFYWNVTLEILKKMIEEQG